jgi:glutamate--cysteine ligase catalytic subunit
MRYGKHSRVIERDSADACAQIEYLVVAFDDDKKTVKLSLRQADILAALASDEELLKQGGGVPDLAKGVVKYGCNPIQASRHVC